MRVKKNLLFFLLLGMGSNTSCKKVETTTSVAKENVVNESVAPKSTIVTAQAVPAQTITQLFGNALRFFEISRNAKGVYRDSKNLEGADYHPCSVANVGMGLISLCIGHKMGWNADAKNQVIKTLNTLIGNTPGFKLDVNAAGFPRHFVDMETGVRAWNSEYSTIDAAIMVQGALFCKKYFANDVTIRNLADRLYKSIDWKKAIADAGTGKIWRELNAQGNGVAGTEALTYNEYINVVYLAFKSENNSSGNGPATRLWNKYYSGPANPSNPLPKKNYWGFDTLTDNTNYFLSSFISQFNYYLCNPYTANTTYQNYSTTMMDADKKWWSFQGVQSYEWGCGAGVSPMGYRADAIENNPSKMVSPHIIAGFIPQNASAATDFMNMYNAGKGIYYLPEESNRPVLWRYSITSPAYRANSISGVDFASELFGLASLPQHCGTNFFAVNNKFDFPVYTFIPL